MEGAIARTYREAYFAVAQDIGYSFASVKLTDLEDACAVLTERSWRRHDAQMWHDSRPMLDDIGTRAPEDNEEYARRLDEIDRELLPSAWSFVTIVASAYSSSLGTGSYPIPGGVDDGRGGLFSTCEHTDYIDHEAWLVRGEPEPNMRCYDGTGGEVRVRSRDGDVLDLDGHTRVSGSRDDQTAGEVLFRATADHCPEFEDYLARAFRGDG